MRRAIIVLMLATAPPAMASRPMPIDFDDMYETVRAGDLDWAKAYGVSLPPESGCRLLRMVAEAYAKRDDQDGARDVLRIQEMHAAKLDGQNALQCNMTAALSAAWAGDEAAARRLVAARLELPPDQRTLRVAQLALIAHERNMIALAKLLAAELDVPVPDAIGSPARGMVMQAVALTDLARAEAAVKEQAECAATERSPFGCLVVVGSAVEEVAKRTGLPAARRLVAAVPNPTAREMLGDRVGVVAAAPLSARPGARDFASSLELLRAPARDGRIDEAIALAKSAPPFQRQTQLVLAAKEAAVAGRGDDAKRAYDELPDAAARADAIELIVRDANPPPLWIDGEIERTWRELVTLEQPKRGNAQLNLLVAEATRGELARVLSRMDQFETMWRPGALAKVAEKMIARGDLDLAANLVFDSLRANTGFISTSDGPWTSEMWPLLRAALAQKRFDVVDRIVTEMPASADAVRLSTVRALLHRRELDDARRYAAAIERPEIRRRGESWINQVATLAR